MTVTMTEEELRKECERLRSDIARSDAEINRLRSLHNELRSGIKWAKEHLEETQILLHSAQDERDAAEARLSVNNVKYIREIISPTIEVLEKIACPFPHQAIMVESELDRLRSIINP